MPDGHWGYGFPIGGVAAFDAKIGIISPGGIGFDINCGMRLITTRLTEEQVRPKLHALVDRLFERVPSGVGCKGFLRLSDAEFDDILVKGAQWCVKNGYGRSEDLRHTENYGTIQGGNPDKVSFRAKARGKEQLGTLGSGNHYLEIQVVDEQNIFDKEIANEFGIFPGQVVIMFHCGSRGCGHQIGTDYLQIFDGAMKEYGISVPDRELACAPFNSPEGQDYFSAMACGANVAFANRQVILHRIRQVFEEVFRTGEGKMGLDLVYDVSHNLAKIETYEINGRNKELIVHRKGSTRSFGPGNPAVEDVFKGTGQPVIIGGSMETGSYVLVGTNRSEKEAFGSTAHGSGRTISRAKAKKMVRGDKLQREMEHRGIYVRAMSMTGLAEEAGFAYKRIEDVVETVHEAGLSKRVVKLRPIGNVKG